MPEKYENGCRRMASSIDHRDAEELIAAYAIGCLSREERVMVATHLAACSACREDLRSYQGVVDDLALGVPEAQPSPLLRQRIVRRAGSSLSPSLAKWPVRTWSQRLLAVVSWKAPVWGPVSAALIVLLLVSNVLLWRQASAPGQNASSMRTVALVGTSSAPSARATVIVSSDGEYGTLVAEGLPTLDEKHQYQLWLIRDGTRTSGAVFSIGADGYGSVQVASPQPLSSYSAFGVTIEPVGGSAAPTGQRVLGSPS